MCASLIRSIKWKLPCNTFGLKRKSWFSYAKSIFIRKSIDQIDAKSNFNGSWFLIFRLFIQEVSIYWMRFLDFFFFLRIPIKFAEPIEKQSIFQWDFENEKWLINYPDFFVTAAENVDCAELLEWMISPRNTHTIPKSFVCWFFFGCAWSHTYQRNKADMFEIQFTPCKLLRHEIAQVFRIWTSLIR